MRHTSGFNACTSSRKQKTAARTAIHQDTKFHGRSALVGIEKILQTICIWDSRYIPPFTIKFNRWKTFCVVHPYSGTRNSIRISWTYISSSHLCQHTHDKRGWSSTHNPHHVTFFIANITVQAWWSQNHICPHISDYRAPHHRRFPAQSINPRWL